MPLTNKQKELSDLRRAMKLTKSFAGYLGNQYYYWKERYENLKNKKP